MSALFVFGKGRLSFVIPYTKESYFTYLDVCACGDLNEEYLNHVLNCLRIGSVRPAGPTMSAACTVGVTVVAHWPGRPGLLGDEVACLQSYTGLVITPRRA